MTNSSFYLKMPNCTIEMTGTRTSIQSKTFLEYQRIACVSEFPNLWKLLASAPANYLTSVLQYSTCPEDSEACAALEATLLESDQDTIKAIEFSWTGALDRIFLLIHCSILNLHLKSSLPSQLALFSFPLLEAVGNSSEALLQYAHSVRNSNALLQRQYYEMKDRLSGCLLNKAELVQTLAHTHNLYLASKSQLKTTIGSIKAMNCAVADTALKVESVLGGQLECTACRNAFKQVMVLPCRHLVACKACAEGNRNLVSSGAACPVCRHKVQETIDVYF